MVSYVFLLTIFYHVLGVLAVFFSVFLFFFLGGGAFWFLNLDSVDWFGIPGFVNF